MDLKNEPLLKLLKQLGGLPVMDYQSDWSEGHDSSDWIGLLTKMRHLGVDFNYMFHFKVGPSLTDNRKSIIYLGQPILLPDEVRELDAGYLRTDIFTGILRKLGHQKLYSYETSIQVARAAGLASKLFLLWKRKNLAEPIDQPELMTVQQFKLLAPNTDWLRLFSGLLDQPVDESAQIGVTRLDYMIELDKQLALANKTDLLNFILLRMAARTTPWLPSRYLLEQNSPDRTIQCMYLMRDLVALPLATEYVINFISDQALEQVQQMVKLIKNEIVELIDGAKWLRVSGNSASMVEAKQKCEAIQEFVSHTEALKDGSLVANFYHGASRELDENEFFMNCVRLQKRKLDLELGRYRSNYNEPNDWLPHSRTITTNAFYEAQRNSINVFAAIMRGTFFNETFPSYINFGALGSLIGHEINHAFDSQGVKLDKIGNLNKSWWGDSVLDQYQKRLQCFIDQYDKKQISGTQSSFVDGFATLDENLADSGGYSVAYRAYVKWATLSKTNEEPLLDFKTNSTTKQQLGCWRKLFWLAAASNWCDSMTPKQAADWASHDVHSPNEFRVNLAMSNEPEFSRTFECPLGSPMNPVRRCSLWAGE